MNEELGIGPLISKLKIENQLLLYLVVSVEVISSVFIREEENL